MKPVAQLPINLNFALSRPALNDTSIVDLRTASCTQRMYTWAMATLTLIFMKCKTISRLDYCLSNTYTIVSTTMEYLEEGATWKK
jgi:hypothetical protein